MLNKYRVIVFVLLIFIFNPKFILGTQKVQSTNHTTTSKNYSTRASQQEVNKNFPEDSALTTMVEQYSQSIRPKLSEVIAYAPKEIWKANNGGQLGMIIADSLRFEASQLLKRPVDVAISNAGGLRADLPAGDITLQDVFTLMPFENKLVVVNMTGKQLWNCCALVVKRFQKTRGFPISGMYIKVNQDTLLEIKINGKPIDFKNTYIVATSDYLYNKGDGYNFLENTGFTNLKTTMRDAVISYFRNIKTIIAPNEPRVVDTSK